VTAADTNVLSEPLRVRPEQRVVAWLSTRDFNVAQLEVIGPWEP